MYQDPNCQFEQEMSELMVSGHIVHQLSNPNHRTVFLYQLPDFQEVKGLCMLNKLNIYKYEIIINTKFSHDFIVLRKFYHMDSSMMLARTMVGLQQMYQIRSDLMQLLTMFDMNRMLHLERHSSPMYNLLNQMVMYKYYEVIKLALLNSVRN